MLTALIVDDEPLAREELRLLLAESGRVEVVGECAHALEAMTALHRLKPDVLFLDIQMPRISGLELVGMLDPDHLPRIVFITAYDEYALRAFEEQAFDYLLKPIEPARLAKTLARLDLALEPADAARLASLAPPLQQIPCMGHQRILLLPLSEVEFIHSDLGGNRVVSAGQSGYTELTLSTLEARTPFIRCHRQYLLNLAQVGEIRLLEGGLAEVVTRSGQKVPVSRRYLRPLKERLAII